MAVLPLSDELAAKLRDLAQKEQRSLDEVVESMLEKYVDIPSESGEDAQETSSPTHNPLVGLVGLLDEFTSETDLSSTIRETLKQHTHPQYGWTKRDRTD